MLVLAFPISDAKLTPIFVRKPHDRCNKTIYTVCLQFLHITPPNDPLSHSILIPFSPLISFL